MRDEIYRAAFAVCLLSSGARARAESLDFGTFVRQVESSSPEAVIDQLHVQRSERAEERSATLADPGLAVSRENVPFKSQNAADAMTITQEPMWRATVTQTFPWPGARAAKAAAAHAGSDGVRIDQKVATEKRRLEAKDIYVGLVALAEAVEVQRNSLQNAEIVLKSASSRIKLGIGSHHELILAQNEKTLHGLNLASMEADLLNLEDHAAQMIGREEAAGLTFDWHLPNELAVPSRDPEGRKPPTQDLTNERILASQVEAESRLQAERRQSLPQFTASGMVMHGDSGMNSFGVMAGVSLPVFSGKVRSEAKTESSIVAEEARQSMDLHERKKRLALAQNRRRLKVLQAQVEALAGEVLANAKQHLQITTADYSQGRSSFALVNDARLQLLKVQLAENRASRDYALAVIGRERIQAGFAEEELDRLTPQVAVGGMGSADTAGGEMGATLAPVSRPSAASGVGKAPAGTTPPYTEGDGGGNKSSSGMGGM